MNLLGKREPDVYGKETLEDINKLIKEEAGKLDIEVEIYQSNYEGDIVERIHTLNEGRFAGLIINPGAFTHYSYAIHDAIKAVGVPAIEVHMSNIHAREAFRNKSVVVPACKGQISGLGKYSYLAALYVFAKGEKNER